MLRVIKVRGVPGKLVPHPSGINMRFLGKVAKTIEGPPDPDNHLVDLYDDVEELVAVTADQMVVKAIAAGSLEQIGKVVVAKNFEEAEKAFAKGS
jgi:hypothetical protein